MLPSEGLGLESQVNGSPIRIYQNPDPDEVLAFSHLENTCGSEGDSSKPRARKWKRRGRGQAELQYAKEQPNSIEEDKGEKKRKSCINGGEFEVERQNDDKRSRSEKERRRSEVEIQGTQLSNKTAVAETQHRRAP
ncbi:hypothetical protein U1Q18_011511 [Sarracenia purpurea var. burkii]